MEVRHSDRGSWGHRGLRWCRGYGCAMRSRRGSMGGLWKRPMRMPVRGTGIAESWLKLAIFQALYFMCGVSDFNRIKSCPERG